MPEYIAIPLLGAAQSEPREEMQELWARLLANAMDPARAENVRPEFVEMLRKLQPIDAKILTIVKSAMPGGPSVGLVDVNQIAARAELRESAAGVSVSHLEEEHCIRRIGSNRAIALTEYGQELMIAVAP